MFIYIHELEIQLAKKATTYINIIVQKKKKKKNQLKSTLHKICVFNYH